MRLTPLPLASPTDNQWADFGRALVFGHEVEDADDVAIFVIHCHIHQLFG